MKNSKKNAVKLLHSNILKISIMIQKNPFSGTYSKDSNSSSSKKNKKFVQFAI